MASIGSRSAAFLAGYHPKKTPVMVQTAKDSSTLQGWMNSGPGGLLINHEAGTATDNHAYHTAGDTNQNGFDEEL